MLCWDTICLGKLFAKSAGYQHQILIKNDFGGVSARIQLRIASTFIVAASTLSLPHAQALNSIKRAISFENDN